MSIFSLSNIYIQILKIADRMKYEKKKSFKYIFFTSKKLQKHDKFDFLQASKTSKNMDLVFLQVIKAEKTWV